MKPHHLLFATSQLCSVFAPPALADAEKPADPDTAEQAGNGGE